MGDVHSDRGRRWNLLVNYWEGERGTGGWGVGGGMVSERESEIKWHSEVSHPSLFQ